MTTKAWFWIVIIIVLIVIITRQRASAGSGVPSADYVPPSGSSSSGSSTSSTTSLLKYKTLERGSKGPEVKYLQNWLNQKWYTNPKLTVDGVFGDKTEKALIHAKSRTKIRLIDL